MLNSGINTAIYSVHSVCSAASTAAFSYGIPLNKIIHLAGWKHVQTFLKHYFKPDLDKEINQLISHNQKELNAKQQMKTYLQKAENKSNKAVKRQTKRKINNK